MQCEEYIVKQGDTLYSLARQYGVTVEELLQLNEGIEPTALIPGSALCIPRGAAIIQDLDAPMPMDESNPVVPPGFKTVYEVRNGDTLSSIAKANGLSIEQLLFANPDVNPGFIREGLRLNIPETDLAIPGSVKYTVKTQESLQDILRKFSIGYGRLKLFNPQTDLTKLTDGDIIFVPEVYGGNIGSCAIGSYSYTIEPGDTIDSIASKFNLTVNQLLSTNAFKDERDVTAGKVICLPLTKFDDLI